MRSMVNQGRARSSLNWARSLNKLCDLASVLRIPWATNWSGLIELLISSWTDANPRWDLAMYDVLPSLGFLKSRFGNTMLFFN
jgi:hypothetical protein